MDEPCDFLQDQLLFQSENGTTESAPSGVSSASVCHPSFIDAGVSESQRRAIFRLARRLKTNDQEKPPSDNTMREAWLGDRFLTKIPWDEFRLLTLEGWDMVKHLLGAGPLADCLAEADRRPLPGFAERYEQPQLKRLVKLCAVLQELKGQKPFALAANALVDELAIGLATAARWLRLLVRDGVLQLVKVGRPGRASEYLYIAT